MGGGEIPSQYEWRNMTENVWTIDELVALTDEIQTGKTEYNGKDFLFHYCELTEAEEPKLVML